MLNEWEQEMGLETSAVMQGEIVRLNGDGDWGLRRKGPRQETQQSMESSKVAP